MNSIKKRYLLFYLLIILATGGCTQISRDSVKTGSEGNYEREVDSLLSLMTLEEKIGQLVAYTSHWDVTGPVISTDNEKYIRQGLCGAIFNAHEVSFNRGLQEIAVNETRLGIPLLFGYDVVHGHRTIFPIPLGEAASWNPGLIEASSRIAAVEATACGVNWTFAPMVDISYDPRWGRVAESSGEDHFLGSEIAKARVRGFQGTDLTSDRTLLACVKHFAAYGAPQAGRDYNTVDMSDRVLREIYLPPFRAAIDAGVASVMTSFNELDGIPATGNKYLLTDILRNEWGFDGFVVTDYNSIQEMIPHGFVANEAKAAELAIKAGVDIDLQSSLYRKYLDSLVKADVISKQIIDGAARKVLQAKFKLGLFKDPFRYFNEERQSNELSTAKHLQQAYKAAAESIVLLKNRESVLPLEKGVRAAVIGPHASLKRDLLGSWIADGKWSDVQTIYDAIQDINSKGSAMYAKGCWFDKEDRSGFAEAIRIARQSDVVILCLGESWHWSGEAASRTSIRIPEIQSALMEEIYKLGKPVVTVLLNGRPLDLSNEIELTDALVEAWYPGTMGAKAIADILFGDVNPSGKLPMTFPRNIGQVPIHYNVKNTGRPVDPDQPDYKYRSRYIDSPNDPLFPFGYGLSFSEFQYRDITLGADTLFPGDTLLVHVEIENNSDRPGQEIVQLYIRDMVGSVTRPILELKGFKKVLFDAGEVNRVEFAIDESMLEFYRADMSHGAEEGHFRVFVGENSEDLLYKDFYLERNVNNNR